MNHIINEQKFHIFVIGNEKGGAGKTTTAMHLITMLLHLNFRVASIDADVRQQSLTRYLEYRSNNNRINKVNLPMPQHHLLKIITSNDSTEKHKQEQSEFEKILDSIKNECDFIVIDTPGTHNFLSSLTHSYADTIITPLNDSFIDFDLLARVDPNNFDNISPAIYSQMVWEQKMVKARRNGKKINWLVMRNRLSNFDAKNKRNVENMINKLSQRIGFTHIPGFSERVVFRELFLQGLTLIDLFDQPNNINLTLSHIAARAELREFISHLKIDKISQSFKKSEDAYKNNMHAIA